MAQVLRSGIERRLDGLGRVVIPAEIRQLLGLRDGDAVDIEHRDGVIVLRPLGDPCPTCGLPQRST
jgi:transcriptional pleiotropic regulator of transition state genes